MSKTTAVGCRLPHGLVLENPLDVKQKVTVKGLNSSFIKGAPFVITEVSSEFWDVWAATNQNYPALKNGSLFAASNSRELESMAKEMTERTGLEPMRTDGKDHRARGVKTADKD